MREIHDAKVWELCELWRYRTSQLVMAKIKSLQAWHHGDRKIRGATKEQRSSRKTRMKMKRRDGSSETIVGEVNGVQRWRKRWRDGSCEQVMEEIESSEAEESRDGGRDRSGYGVIMETEASQRMEKPYFCG